MTHMLTSLPKGKLVILEGGYNLRSISSSAIEVVKMTQLQDLLPAITNHLGPDNLDNLQWLAEQFQKQSPGAETFEEAADEKQASQWL